MKNSKGQIFQYINSPRHVVLATPVISLLAAVTAACEPEHYYAFCDEQDANGWKLVNVERDSEGYIMACTYTSPDGRQSYTPRCSQHGCD